MLVTPGALLRCCASEDAAALAAAMVVDTQLPLSCYIASPSALCTACQTSAVQAGVCAACGAVAAAEALFAWGGLVRVASVAALALYNRGVWQISNTVEL